MTDAAEHKPSIRSLATTLAFVWIGFVVYTALQQFSGVLTFRNFTPRFVEPVIGADNLGTDKSAAAEFVTVSCPYCGEPFETSADVSAGPCIYVEDCQICCQPIEMELRVDDDGELSEVLARRGDS